MRDPWPAPSVLSEAVKPITDLLHLHTLPPHAHEILLSFAFYTLVEKMISPQFSAYVFPQHYPKLPRRTKVTWDLHFTSFINAFILCGGVFYLMLYDDERLNGDWQDRMWAYSGVSGAVQAVATGYFMWDFMVCIVNYRTLGVLDLLHGTVGMVAALLGFRPFALYYGLSYLLFELSTPFVHLHWLFDKIDMTGSPAQWYNGVVLITVFFCCRLLLGPYLLWLFVSDLWTAYNHGVWTTHVQFPADLIPTTLVHTVPLWVAGFMMTGNAVLMFLNFFWFSKMISTIRKRFRPTEGGTKSTSSTKTADRQKGD